MKNIIVILSIFCITDLFAVQGAKNLARQVTTQTNVLVNEASKHNALFKLVEEGMPVELLAAILRGADVNATDGEKTLLQHARQLGRDDMTAILIRHGAEESDVMPAQEEKTEVVLPAMTPAQTLADNALRQQKCDNTLHLAVLAGQTDKARGLIAASNDINGKDELGRTAAHHAAITGNLEIITTLVENHADINLKDNFGNTPYTAAELAGQQEIVAYLTPMMDAAIVEEIELAELQEAALELRAANKTCGNRAF